MLKIVRTAARDSVVFALSGRIDAEHAAQLQAAFDAEDQPIILDLREVRRVDRDAMTALTRWDAEGIKFENCPAYVREWIARLQKKR